MLAFSQARSMPERWTELNSARRARKQLAADVEQLKQTCEKDCQKENISQCPQCYQKIVERMQSRYRDADEREWFAQRRAFLQELDGHFAEVKTRKRSLKSVEASIESEKEAWYRWMLRRHPDFLSVADNGTRQRGLRAMLDDPDQSRDELVTAMWEGVGQPEDWSLRVDDFAAKVEAAGSDGGDLRKLYEAEFFMDRANGEKVLEHSQKYLDAFRANQTMTPEDVVDMVVRDYQSSKLSQTQREGLIKKLEELRRAKAAVEQNKTKDKGPAEQGASAAVREELYNLPPCIVCKGAVDAKDVLSCSVCQAATALGGEPRLTVYCSETCYIKGHNEHVEKHHACESGPRCIRLAQGEDTVMEDAESKAVVCKECLGQEEKKLTLWCSQACAEAQIADHRQEKHGVKSGLEEGTQGLVAPLEEEVMGILQRENPGLILSSV